MEGCIYDSWHMQSKSSQQINGLQFQPPRGVRGVRTHVSPSNDEPVSRALYIIDASTAQWPSPGDFVSRLRSCELCSVSAYHVNCKVGRLDSPQVVGGNCHPLTSFISARGLDIHFPMKGLLSRIAGNCRHVPCIIIGGEISNYTYS